MFGSSALNTQDEGINDAYLGGCVVKEMYMREVSTANNKSEGMTSSSLERRSEHTQHRN